MSIEEIQDNDKSKITPKSKTEFQESFKKFVFKSKKQETKRLSREAVKDTKSKIPSIYPKLPILNQGKYNYFLFDIHEADILNLTKECESIMVAEKAQLNQPRPLKSILKNTVQIDPKLNIFEPRYNDTHGLDNTLILSENEEEYEKTKQGNIL